MARLKKGRKAISELIATVLLILVVISISGMIYGFIMPMIRGNIETSQKCSDAELEIVTEGYTCYNSAANEVQIEVARGEKNVELSGINLVVSGGGKSKSATVTGGGIISSDLVGYWGFNDGTAKDSSNYKNDGTINGATSVDGKLGKALSFEGSDYVLVPDSPSLDIKTNAFTTSFWIKPSVDVTSMSTYPIGLIKRPWAVGGYANHFVNSNGEVNVQYCWNGGSDYVYSSTSFKAGQWYHIAGTFDGSSIKLYINGILENSKSVTNAMGSSAGYDLEIGSNWQGIIDEVKIWNRALKENEIQREASGTSLPGKGEADTYVIKLSDIGITSPEKVSASAIVNILGKDKVCSTTAESSLNAC